MLTVLGMSRNAIPELPPQIGRLKHLRVLEVPSYEKPRMRGDAKLRSFRDGHVILETILKNLF